MFPRAYPDELRAVCEARSHRQRQSRSAVTPPSRQKRLSAAWVPLRDQALAILEHVQWNDTSGMSLVRGGHENRKVGVQVCPDAHVTQQNLF